MTQINKTDFAAGIQEFNSVDEIYFFMENMFTEGFNEKHVSMALDVFLRDFDQFEEKDLKSETFLAFVAELGVNIITFKEEATFVKTAKFMDWYCLVEPTIWVNLELYTIKKENVFKGTALITMC